MEQYLRGYGNYEEDDWVEWLAIAEFAYNNSVHSATGETLFYLAYGFYLFISDTPQFASGINIPSARERVLGLINSRLHLEQIWADAAKTQSKYYDQRHTTMSYKVRDQAWLFGQNIRTNRPAKKLDFKYHGPFTIGKCIGSHAYKLELPSTFHNIHDVFHVSLLEPYRTIEERTPSSPLLVEVEGEEHAEVEEILDNRIHYGTLQYLVKGFGFPVTDNEWLKAEGLGTAEE